MRRNIVFQFWVQIIVLAASGSVTFSNGANVCIQWDDYHEGSTVVSHEDGTMMKKDSYLGNKGTYICRVENTDERQQPKYEVGTTIIRDDHAHECLLFHQFKPQQQISYSTFQIARGNKDICNYYWMPISYDVNPLNPNAVIIGQASGQSDKPNFVDIALCRHDLGDGVQRVGRMFRNGNLFGECGIHIDGEEVMIGGGYESLSAWLLSDEIDINHNETATFTEEQIETHQLLYSEITQRVDQFLEDEDKQLISKITGYPFDQLMCALEDPTIIGLSAMKDILSMKRFLPHQLNLQGLSLLRSVLAERMINARRDMYGLGQHPDAVEWEKEGVLLKDYDYYTHPDNRKEFQLLLQMCSASKPDHIPTKLTWVEKNVTANPNDTQLQAHIDTFHSVVKMWVYERGDVTIEKGPLHFMRGSARNNESKLRWIYSVTIPPSIEAIKEPSLRYNGNAILDKMPDEIRPVLPLKNFQRTLIIADTSGIHHRGPAIPGTVRKTIRVQDDMQGGIPRLDPFHWSGMESWKEINVCEETKCRLILN